MNTSWNHFGNFSTFCQSGYITNSEKIILTNFPNEYYNDETTRYFYQNFSSQISKFCQIKSGFKITTISTSLNYTAHLYNKKHHKDIFGLICRSDNPLSKKKKITFDDMINEPIIVSRQSLAHDLRKWAGERLDELTIAATGDIPFNLSLLVKEGIGSLLCFDKIINTTETSNLRYIPLDPPMLSPLYIIWKKNAELTPPARKLMERFRYLKL